VSRVYRGGSWNNHARNVRCAVRNAKPADNRNDNLGFRLVRAHEEVWRDPPEQIGFRSEARVVLAKTKWPPACWSLLADAGAKARRSAVCDGCFFREGWWGQLGNFNNVPPGRLSTRWKQGWPPGGRQGGGTMNSDRSPTWKCGETISAGFANGFGGFRRAHFGWGPRQVNPVGTRMKDRGTW